MEWIYPILGKQKCLPFYLSGIGIAEPEYHVIREEGLVSHQLHYTQSGRGNLVVGGTDICLVDGNYNSYSTNGTKYFNMNHSSNTNAGGWKGCDLRYDVLGSTNTNDGDATATTATNPVANTLMAALPSDLRAVMQPMTIYTDNTGGGSDNASYVTKTTDYLPLLAEYEIFGTRTYANSAEKNYPAQFN